ncbi:G2/mitotic-specific cyclin [Nowakowskiella sp. JEL0078]|nr:G2/mitotic-specific cyclin [Nowakowskiella sp. JEL0078]
MMDLDADSIYRRDSGVDFPVEKEIEKRVILEKPVENFGFAEDPLLVTEYAEDIFSYLRMVEVRTQPLAECMSHQRFLTPLCRTELVDWIISLQISLGALNETLFLAINILDRFLSVKMVVKEKLKLVGLCSFIIAAKYEETSTATLREYSLLTKCEFKEHDIMIAERFILHQLGFSITYPGPLNFIRRITEADIDEDYKRASYIRLIAKYFCEASLTDNRFIGVLPSVLAASAMFLARKMMDPALQWTMKHVKLAEYKEDQIFDIAKGLLDCASRVEQHQTTFNKYNTPRNFQVSTYVQQYLTNVNYKRQ